MVAYVGVIVHEGRKEINNVAVVMLVCNCCEVVHGAVQCM